MVAAGGFRTTDNTIMSRVATVVPRTELRRQHDTVFPVGRAAFLSCSPGAAPATQSGSIRRISGGGRWSSAMPSPNGVGPPQVVHRPGARPSAFGDLDEG